MLFYIAAAAFNFADTFSTSIGYEATSIWLWAVAESGIHLFFALYIYEMYDDDNLKLTIKEYTVITVLLLIFIGSQGVLGLNVIFLHQDRWSNLTANWVDLWMTIFSMASDFGLCICLIIMYRYRLETKEFDPRNVNDAGNNEVDELSKYLLLLLAGTIYTFFGQAIFVMIDGIHVHNQSERFWVDDTSSLDQWTYIVWSLDTIINIYLIYLNIESGKYFYKVFCIKCGCQECIRKCCVARNQAGDYQEASL